MTRLVPFCVQDNQLIGVFGAAGDAPTEAYVLIIKYMMSVASLEAMTYRTIF